MIVNITDRLVFGNEAACTHDGSGQVAVVHACKEPCHRHAVGYSTRTIPKTHAHYLVLERGYHLYLNLIDPPQPLFMIESFRSFLTFVDRNLPDRRVLIHCNQGESRAPSLALLYAAKRLRLFPAETYEVAAAAFRAVHPYRPGDGISAWLSKHWSALA